MNGADEPTIAVILNKSEPIQTVKLGAWLFNQAKADLVILLEEYKDVFTWKHEDMPGINKRIPTVWQSMQNVDR